MRRHSLPQTEYCASESPTGINDSWLLRRLVIASITLLRPIRPSRGGVLMLTSNICIKYGRARHLSEAAAMAFVAKHTAIPVPKVFCAFQHEGVTYIVMERIKGDIIRNRWFSMTEEMKANLLSQLHELISRLRDIPPPQPGRVGAVDYTQLFDSRIQSNGFGPFPDSRGFHKFLRLGMTKSGNDDPELEQLMTAHDEKQYPTCFTHGDLSTFNILVGQEGKIVGIIDWEMAGWYPIYWEYTSTWHVSPYDEAWRPEVDKFLDSYPKELEMEQLRRKFFPVF